MRRWCVKTKNPPHGSVEMVQVLSTSTQYSTLSEESPKRQFGDRSSPFYSFTVVHRLSYVANELVKLEVSPNCRLGDFLDSLVAVCRKDLNRSPHCRVGD